MEIYSYSSLANSLYHGASRLEKTYIESTDYEKITIFGRYKGESCAGFRLRYKQLRDLCLQKFFILNNSPAPIIIDLQVSNIPSFFLNNFPHS